MRRFLFTLFAAILPLTALANPVLHTSGASTPDASLRAAAPSAPNLDLKSGSLQVQNTAQGPKLMWVTPQGDTYPVIMKQRSAGSPEIGYLDKLQGAWAAFPALIQDKVRDYYRQSLERSGPAALGTLTARQRQVISAVAGSHAVALRPSPALTTGRPFMPPRPAAYQRTVNACYESETSRQARLGRLPPLDQYSSLGMRLADAKSSGGAVFYDRKSVPRAWTDSPLTFQGSRARLMAPHTAVNSHMYGKMGYHSDGAREFPWAHTAGLDISANSTAEKFVIPPPSGPMAQSFFRSKRNSRDYFGVAIDNDGQVLSWRFTPGTTFGEVLKVRDPETMQEIPFEIRLRQKTPQGTWKMDVLRPFGNPAELLQALQTLCFGPSAPPECFDPKVNSALSALQSPRATVTPRSRYINKQTFGTKRDPLRLSSTANEATEKMASIHVLPDLPAAIVRWLLTKTPFKSVFNKPWVSGLGKYPDGWAPTSQSEFNIVPKNYFGAFIPMTQNACMRCHNTAGKHVENFDPQGLMYAYAPGDRPRPRTWYNNIPGDDGILSWHPYSARAVANRGHTHPNSFFECLKREGLIASAPRAR